MQLDPPPADFRLLRFWSDSVPAAQRLDAWREILGRKLMRVEIDPLPGPPFHVDASMRVLDDFRFGIAAFSASLLRRTPKIVAADNDDFLLIINMEGSFVISEQDGELILNEGDAYFMNCRHEKNFIRPMTGRMLGARFERSLLSELVPNLDDRGDQVIPRDTQGLRLLTIYLRELDDNQTLTDPDLRKLVSGQIHDIASLILSPFCRGADAESIAGGARLRLIKSYIDDNLKKQDLSVVDVAVAHSLSERQVQRLFEAEETTFSGYLLNSRLERVYLALKDPRRAHRGIGQIAVGCGFSDISHFNRAFRRRYDRSPSDVRAQDVVAPPRNGRAKQH